MILRIIFYPIIALMVLVGCHQGDSAPISKTADSKAQSSPTSIRDKKKEIPSAISRKPVIESDVDYLRRRWGLFTLHNPVVTSVGAASKGKTSHDPQSKFFKGMKGRLAYSWTRPNGKSFLSLHTFGNDPSAEVGQPHSVRTYRLGSIRKEWDAEIRHIHILNLTFSPSGRYVAYQINAEDDIIWQVLDTQTNKVRLVLSSNIRYGLASWSPDGKFIAFLRGGSWDGGLQDTHRGETRYAGPLQLVTYNFAAGKEQIVATSDSLSGPFRWLGQHTLIYGLLPDHKIKDANPKHPVMRPNVYLYSPENRKSTLLIEDAYHPVPSPDGQWIAFFGSADPSHRVPLMKDPLPEDQPENLWRFRSNGAPLCVVKRDGTGRTALRPFFGTYPSVIWLADNKRLLVTEDTKPSPTAEATVTEWNIVNQSFRTVSTLIARDDIEQSQTFIRPQFTPTEISSNQQQMYFFASELKKVGNKETGIDSLKAANISSPTTTTIARIQGAQSVAWHFSSTIGNS